MQDNNWNESDCRFLTKGQQCTTHRGESSWFCKPHQKTYGEVSNQDLLEQHATATAESIVVKNKVIHLRDVNMNDGSWDNFYNSWHELINRDYEDMDILECIGNILEQRNFFANLMKQLRGERKWRKFEKLVAGIHLPGEAGTKVKFDDTITDKRTGRPRQIDVSVVSTQGFYKHLVIIECKDKSRKVTVEWIEGFRSKIEDVGAQKGVMVSPLGFTEGAVQKAESYGIDLFTLTPQLSGWIKRKKHQTERLAVPDGFRFDCPPPPNYSAPANPSFEKFLIRCNSDSSIKTLLDFTSGICERATLKKFSLPTEVKINFGEEKQSRYSIQFPNSHTFVPLFSITIKLKAHIRHVRHTTIDIPPKVIGYTYNNLLTGDKYQIRTDDIPKGVDTVLEPGQYYTDKFDFKWWCISIESNEAIMWLLDLPLQGRTICVESKQSLDEAYNFVPLDDSVEQNRLEKIYRSAVSRDSNTES